MADDKNRPAERTQAKSLSTSQSAPRLAESGTLLRTSAPDANNAASTSTASGGKTGGTDSATPSSSDWQVTNPSQWDASDKSILSTGSVLKERFVLEQIVGKGGMGTVFCARDRRKEEAQDRFPYVAVKILNEDFKRHPESLKLLQREARKAQQLAHPNIVNVYDFDRDGANVFIVMELLQGQSLDRVIKQTGGKGLSVKDALSIVSSLGQALAYAHKKNVVHLDFKPANAYLCPDGSVKVLDFGIARAMSRDDTPDAAPTKFLVEEFGALTPSYASLEMAEGQEPDPRDDIYALACVTYELLTGKHPFGRQPAKFALEYGLKLARPKGLSARRWQALRHGLAFKRADRVASVDEFVAALTSAQSSSFLRWSAAAATIIAIAGAGVYWYASTQRDGVQQHSVITSASTSHQASLSAVKAAQLPAVIDVTPQKDKAQPDLTKPVTDMAVLTTEKSSAKQALIERRKETLLRLASSNDVVAAEKLMNELRALLPGHDIFIEQTASHAVAAADLRLMDNSLQHTDYSSAAEYLRAARALDSDAPGLQQHSDALEVVAQLDKSLRSDSTLSADGIRGQLIAIKTETPKAYAAIESKLASTFADRIQHERRTNSANATALLAVATQVFGNLPAITALNTPAQPTPASPLAQKPAQLPISAPARTEPVKPEPVAPESQQSEPAKPATAQKKEKTNVIITF